MQLKGVLALLALGVATAHASDDIFDQLDTRDFEDISVYEEDSLEARAGCTSGVHIVAAGGEGSVKGDLGYLQSLVDSIMNAIPRSNLHQVPYPPGADAPTSIGYAVPKMQQHIRSYAARCPRSKMAILGYSVGGAVVMNVLCGDSSTGEGELPDRYRHNIAANIVYGDPTYLPGLSYDAGTCTSGTSDVPRAKPGRCFPYGRKTKSYCDYNDPECCGGNDPNVHFEYPGLYDGDATNFVKARHAAARRNNH